MATETEGSTEFMEYSEGTYSTPDGRGHIEFNTDKNEWEAWRDDIEGITAGCDSFDEAVQFAFYGQGEVQYKDGKYVGIKSQD